MKKLKINFEAILGFLILVIFFFIITNLVNNFNSSKLTESNFILSGEFYNIGNLINGNDVKINGVKVGEVNNIALDEDNFTAVVKINLDYSYKIPIDSKLIISSDGLIGGSYINIIPGSDINFLKNNELTQNTVDAISLENIISDIIFSN